MTQRPSPQHRPRQRPRRRTAMLLASLLVLAAGLPGAAASPEPSTLPAPAATPDLTFAPLVTLPPIMVPTDPTPLDLADGYALGAADAPVALEVWEDFQCPFCRRWAAEVKPELIERYIRTGKVRLTYRPLAFLGEESRWAAVAADLAAEQDRFWPLHDLLYANQLGENVGSFGLDRIILMAQAAGLEMGPFLDGLRLEDARARYAQLEARSRADAAPLGIRATPSVVVNGQLLDLPDLDTVSGAIEAALAAAPPAP